MLERSQRKVFVCNAIIYLPSVVDEDVVHLEVGFLATLLVFKLDEGVLQAIAGLSIANHFTTEKTPLIRFCIKIINIIAKKKHFISKL